MMMLICLFMPPVISVFLLEKVILKYAANDWSKMVYSYIFSFLSANTISMLFFSLSYSDYYKRWRWETIDFDKTENCVKYLMLSIVISFLVPFIYKLIVKYIEEVKKNHS